MTTAYIYITPRVVYYYAYTERVRASLFLYNITYTYNRGCPSVRLDEPMTEPNHILRRTSGLRDSTTTEAYVYIIISPRYVTAENIL